MNQSYIFHTIAKETAKKIKEFYKDPENLKNFEKWRKRRNEIEC